jgi:hypothetical protein
LLFVSPKAVEHEVERAMRLATDRANAKAAWLIGAVLAMSGISAGLQTVPNGGAANSELLQVTVRRVVISLPDRKLALFHNGQVVKIYRVAVGKPSTPSPRGAFRIVNRVTNPTYYHKGQVIPSGRNNPVGSRWMGLSAKGYGIHGTNQPNSIGKAASTGCIRMSKRDLEELFTLLEVGDAVEIRAERDEQVASIFGPSIEMLEQAEIASGSAGGQ